LDGDSDVHVTREDAMEMNLQSVLAFIGLIVSTVWLIGAFTVAWLVWTYWYYVAAIILVAGTMLGIYTHWG
jgi:hypothetical protein